MYYDIIIHLIMNILKCIDFIYYFILINCLEKFLYMVKNLI